MHITSQEELDNKLKFPSYAARVTGAQWHMLYSFEFMRGIAVSSWLSTINSMSHHHINSYAWFGVNIEKNSFGALKIPAGYNTVTAWEWKYDLAKQTFVKDVEGLTYDQIYYLKLTREKSAALDIIHRRINNIRRNFVSEINAQHSVYRYKEQEAEQILRLNPNDIDPSKFIFINDYAELKNIDIVSAAKEILLQVDFTKSRLSDTETIRLKYCRTINLAQDIPEVRGAVSAFMQESIGHATT